jgi:hypothetical protein
MRPASAGADDTPGSRIPLCRAARRWTRTVKTWLKAGDRPAARWPGRIGDRIAATDLDDAAADQKRRRQPPRAAKTSPAAALLHA